MKVDDQSDVKTRDPEVVQHLTALLSRNLRNNLRVDDDSIRYNQIGNIFTDLNAFEYDVETLLLSARQLPQFELDDERVLAGLLMQPVAQFIEHHKRRPDYSVG